jgi:hypothetical protein
LSGAATLAYSPCDDRCHGKNIANTASQAASDALARVQEPAKKCEKNTAAARHIVLKRNIRLFGETIPLGEIKSVSLTR